MSSGSDRNLLFGIVALHMDLIDRDQLLSAMHQWLSEKETPLGALLVRAKALEEQERALLDALVAKHLEKHNHSVSQSLATLSSIESLRGELQELQDADLDGILADVSQARSSAAGPDDTLSYSARDPASGEPRFRILRFHDKGGLGRVYVARDEELGRDVALKEINPERADDEHTRARFVMEAEVTGGLEHPGIVPVYGLGQYADGRPFYAMRFIRGDSLKDAVKQFHGRTKNPFLAAGRGSLELRKLLGRFIDVCQAIEYAHSRGVLHRDLKPGNIMLGKYGETLVVDWGLAKAQGHVEVETSSAEAESTLRPRSGSGSAPTEMGIAMGTPAYMSPEQAAGRWDLLGQASDVYSLGATLFHLLTNRPPISETDGEVARRYAEQGHIDLPREVSPSIPRPLAAICQKAMSLRREDRYHTAAALAEDVEHWLADEPVTAIAEPLWQRSRRWLRRHPTLVATSIATVLLGLISLAVLMGIASHKNRQLADANRELKMANISERTAKLEAIAQRNAAEAARAKEAEARKTAETVTDYLVEAFRSPDPARDGREITIAETLDQMTSTMDESLANQPLVKARLLNAIGRSYIGLGLPKKAIDVLEEAIRLRTARLDQDHPDTLTTMNNLATAYQDDEQLDKAARLFEQTLERSRQLEGEGHLHTIRTMCNLAGLYVAKTQLDKAVPLARNTLSLARQHLGDRHRITLATMANLARAYQLAGDLEKALPLFEETRRLCGQTLGDFHPDTLMAENNLALGYAKAGQFDKAITLLETTLELRKQRLGEDHPSTLVGMGNLAITYQDAGQLKKALPLLEETLRLQQKQRGEDHPSTLRTLANLASVYKATGQSEKALPLLEKIRQRVETAFGVNHLNTLAVMNNLADAYAKARQFDKALPLFELTLQRIKTKLGDDHPNTLAVMNNLAVTYQAAGRLEQAIPILEETLRGAEKKLGKEHPQTLGSMGNLASGYKRAGHLDKAIPLFEKTLQLRRKHLGQDHPDALTSMNNLARAYQAADRLDDAMPLFNDTLRMRREKLGYAHPDSHQSANNLAEAYKALGQADNVVRVREETLRLEKQHLPEDHPLIVKSMGNLVIAYMDANRLDQALEALREFEEKNGTESLVALQLVNNLAVRYRSQGELDKALSLFEESLQRSRRQLGQDHPQTLTVMINQAQTLEKARRLVEAEALTRACLTIQKEKMPDHWLRFIAASVLGSVLLEQKKYSEAEPALIEAYQGLKQRETRMPAEAGPDALIHALDRIVDLYVAWGKPEQVESWKAKLREEQQRRPSK